MHIEDVFSGVAVAFEAIGALTMVLGFIMSLILAGRAPVSYTHLTLPTIYSV